MVKDMSDGASHAPNVYDAEPIPTLAREEVERLLLSGDLFRYTAAKDAPVTLLEQEFAAMLGAKYALAVASCSAALFLSLKALDLPRDALRHRSCQLHTGFGRMRRQLPH